MIRCIVTGAVAALVLSGCVATRSTHGYVVEFGETGLDAMPGIDSRESVLARFGEPSIRPPLDDSTWYYISQKSNMRAFRRAEVSERTVVAFNFDADGMVSEVNRYNLEDGVNIDLVDRITATRGKELSFFEQLLGGVGAAPGLPVPGQPGGTGGPGGPGGP